MPFCRSDLEGITAISAAAKQLLVITLPTLAVASRSIHRDERLDLRPCSSSNQASPLGIGRPPNRLTNLLILNMLHQV
jgi:hypothetical protein